MPDTDASPQLTPAEIRRRLVETLELDLVGPWPGHELEQEMLHRRNRPSNWYLTGFLIPVASDEAQAADDEADDDFDAVDEGGGDETAEDRVAAKKAYFPSSIGLSALIPADVSTLTVTVRWGDYRLAKHTPESADGEEEPKPIDVWRRTPREEQVLIALGEPGVLTEHAVPDSGGLQVHALERPVPTDGHDDLPDGTRSVSVFLVNRRVPDAKTPDRAYAFQPVIEVACDPPFVPRSDLRGAAADEWDELVNDLHYADVQEYATGHGIAADWELVDGKCHTLWTAWLPKAEVEKTTTAKIDGVELSMAALGALADGAAVRAALAPLAAHYRDWIATQETHVVGLPQQRRQTAQLMLHNAGLAAERIERGIEALAGDAPALDAFRVANRAVGAAITRRFPEVASPAWRPFQLAFILLNLRGIADPHDVNRETVDLLFFPTGGGKTEAYLGLAAFTIVLRRLRHPGADGMAAGGVSVVMRYTLRLLTLDQLSRAAGLICALELEREQDPGRYGIWPFEIGLWVGKAGTPNVMGHKGDKRDGTARSKTRQYKNNPKGKPIPVPIEACPWCQTPFSPDSFTLLPDDDHPDELRIVCTNFDCDFIGDRPLPIVAVDDSIYRRLPAFIIATVDKFATLPWIAESGVLLGGATRHAPGKGFAGPGERTAGWGAALPAPLPAPDLVIQDELHLISGPLGTMAGLYETAIDALSLQHAAVAGVRPKIVASTATVRRAADQVQALFGRGSTQVFPPPGPDRRDAFFARTVTAGVAPARQYVGVASQGRNPKVAMRRVWLALMSAAEKLYRDHGGHQNPDNPVDPYMTVLGYFNALRELGGGRRILEEEVQNTLKGYGTRRRVDEPTRLFQDRTTFSEVVELTSRVSTTKVADARRRLGQGFAEKDRVDCAIATNMISVGLDIPRLGLMGVIGQPKTAAEYIQATSRVGRDETRGPGLVVTLLNIHKPRDRSHYERFRHFHETFYRSVEVGSVTPFSARALDRGFAGAIVALARHACPELTKARGVEQIEAVRVPLEQLLKDAVRTRVDQQQLAPDEHDEVVQSVESRVSEILDGWETIYEDHHSDGVAMQYQKYELTGPKPLLREMLESGLTAEEQLFRVNRSLRDVEPGVNLFVRDLDGKFVEIDE
ncbi:MAG TPA: DISARM system helicase DrmA [Solirubrobacter sp.]|nr:DISARM system helicase DrmA [Solirubrobacter sp.]